MMIGSIRRVTASYLLIIGTRKEFREYAFPEGYDDTFIDDYECQADIGNFDESNGITINGQYGYYATDSYPLIMKCSKGTPDNSF
jgi:hypothetical protein